MWFKYALFTSSYQSENPHIIVGKPGSGGFYFDGKPLTFTTAPGDGTVLVESAYLGDFVDFQDNVKEAHASLVKAYMDDVLKFITGRYPGTG
jgi:hypothetical protein